MSNLCPKHYIKVAQQYKYFKALYSFLTPTRTEDVLESHRLDIELYRTVLQTRFCKVKIMVVDANSDFRLYELEYPKVVIFLYLTVRSQPPDVYTRQTLITMGTEMMR